MPGRDGGGGVSSRRDRRHDDPRERRSNKPKPNPLAINPNPFELQLPPPDKATLARRRREIIRRQILLRNAGYKVVVDGTWGPRAQRAWVEYRRTRSVVIRDTPADNVDLSKPNSAPSAVVDAREQATVLRMDKAKREKLAKRQAEREHQRIVARAGELKKDPTAARKMNIRKLTEILREVDYNPVKNPQLTKALQENLKAHGYKVVVNGRFDKRTYNAMKKAERDQARKEKNQMIAFIKARLFDTGVVKAGEKPPWWTFGEMPTPEKLLEKLQLDNFASNAMFRQLLTFALSPQAGWEAARAAQLSEIAQTIQPFGTASMMDRVAGEAGTMPSWMYYSDIMSVSDFSSFFDLSEESGYTEEQRKQILKQRATNPEIVAANAVAVGRTRAQVKALLLSDGAKEFQQKMKAMVAVEEKKAMDFARNFAAKDPPWWGQALQAAMWPGYQVRDLIVADVFTTAALVKKPGTVVRSLLGDEKAHDEVTMTSDEAQKEIDSWNPILRYSFEVVVDPLNFVAPLRIASTAGRGALVATRLSRGASLGRYVWAGKEAGTLTGFKYTRGTWSKLDVATDFLSLHAGQAFADRFALMASRASKTKDVMLGEVSSTLRTTAIAGWKTVTGREGVVHWEPPKVEGVPRGLLDATDKDVAQAALTLPGLKGIVKAFVDRGIPTRNGLDPLSELTQPATALRAHLAETFRPLAIAQVAIRAANERYMAIMEEFAPTRAARAVLKKRAEAEATDIYLKVLNGVGAHHIGTANKELREMLLKNEKGVVEPTDVIKIVERRVGELMQELEKVVFPAIQEQVEKQADAAFEGLAAKAAASSSPASGGKRTVVELPNPSEREMIFADVVANPDNYLYHGTSRDAAWGIEEEGLLAGTVSGALGPALDYSEGGMVAVFRREDFTPPLYEPHGQKPVAVFKARDFTTELSNAGRRGGESGDNFEMVDLSDVKPSVRNSMDSEWAGTLGLPDPSAPTHPLWDANDMWVGRAAAQDSDLVRVIRESFEGAELAEIRNPGFGITHTYVEMRAAVTQEVARRVGRLDDYAARIIDSGAIPEEDLHLAAMKHEELEAGVIENVKSAWKEGDNGKWYDTREFVQVSNLYLRHLDRFSKKRLVFGENGVDEIAALGEAAPGQIRSPLEDDIFNLAAQMMGAHSIRLADTGFTTPGVTGVQAAAGKHLRDVIDARMHALRKAEESALPGMLRGHSAVWRALQYSQSRKAQVLYRGMSAQLMLWKFATLALRPAWAVRNFIDNVAKALIAGARDPRLFFIGPASYIGDSRLARGVASVFDVGIGQLRQFIDFCDNMFGTNVRTAFDAILDDVWKLPSSILTKLFAAHNLDVPEEVFEMGLRNDVFAHQRGLKLTNMPSSERLIELGLETAPGNLAVRGRAVKASLNVTGSKLANIFWHILGDVPENYARRIVYRSEYTKAMRELADSGLSSVDMVLESTNRAIAAVEKTLFNYSNISVLEDNLVVFFPFIQFWRKNTGFWIESLATKPWLPVALLHFDDERRKSQADLPIWMQRYFHTDDIADALAVVPGLDEAFNLLGLGDGAQMDPISMMSLAPFYRGFKAAMYGENQLLPSDKAGVAILAPIIDTLNDYGLGINPLFRKPLESAGVANYRAWQRIFPQTALAEAIAMRTGHDGIASMARSFEMILSLDVPGLMNGVASDSIAENFDYWVQTVVAEQVARGNEPDIAAAEETVRDWFLVQNLWGYFGGIYWRRATPEDLYLAKLADDVYSGELDRDKLTDSEKKKLHFWEMRGMDRLTYTRYVELLPVIESYYRATDWKDKEEIVKDNPEIIRWVDGDYRGRPISQRFIRHTQKYVDTELFIEATEIADNLDLPYQTRKVAEDMFVTPSLLKFWRQNDTASDIRKRMIQGAVSEHLNELNTHFFAIPESDFEARNAFIADHPELVRHWDRNNSPSDDWHALSDSARSTLRSLYFAIVREDGFEKAAPFLKQFPFMFEGTASEDKVEDGEWVPGNGKWSAERIADFREAKPHLKWFFDEFLPKIGEQKAFAWLEKSDTPAAKIIREYLKKYPSSKRLEWLKAAPFLKIYFGLPADERRAWLAGDSEGAKIVRAFFEKHGNKEGEHAVDYLETKPMLDFYFSLPKEKRSAWLQSDDPRAKKVLEYFKKYGKKHQYERAFKKLVKAYPGLANGTPEQAKRMEFWRKYFALRPDQRPMFVLEEAEKHGVFVYGEFGEEMMADKESEYMRRAVGLGLSERQSAFLYVKPLLAFYKTLDPGERGLFLRANPELAQYFDRYSTKSITGDKKLDALVEQYMKLPPGSFGRSEFLQRHPEVQDWFDGRGSPAEKAMRNVLEQYFALPVGQERADFVLNHPEVAAYFDRRRDEKRMESEALSAFDRADPRLAPFYENAADLLRAAERMRFRLRTASDRALGLEIRRERRAA